MDQSKSLPSGKDLKMKPILLADGPEENSSKLLSTPFIEDPQHRLKWIAYLEFTHNEEVEDLTWDKVSILQVISPDCDFAEFILTLDDLHRNSLMLRGLCLLARLFLKKM